MDMLVAEVVEQGGPWVLLLMLVPVLALDLGALAVALFALNKAKPEDVPAMFEDFMGGFGRWPNPLGGMLGRQGRQGDTGTDAIGADREEQR